MRGVVLFLLVFVLLSFLPLGVWRAYLLDAGVFLLLYTALALSWDLVARTGQLSLAHGAFFGLGAYGVGLLEPHVGHASRPPFGELAGGALRPSPGLRDPEAPRPLLRHRQPGLQREVLRTLALKLPFTGGPIGLPVPPGLRRCAFGAYYLAFAVLAVAVGLSLWAEHSPFRLAQAACRQSEPVARVLGVRVVRGEAPLPSFWEAWWRAWRAGSTP
jgi:branched-chain amino acid transport system permease protein